MAKIETINTLEALLDATDSRDAQIIADGLSGVAHITLGATTSLITTRNTADIVIIARIRLTDDILDTVRVVNKAYARPIAMFVAQCDPVQIAAAVDAGISALVVDGLKAERIPAAIQLAHARFQAERSLRAELERARSDLAARKTIERAKGILMERKKLSEAEAYGVLRRSAMNDGRTIAEIANAIMTVDRLLMV